MERNTWLVPPDDRRRLSIAPTFPSFHVFVGDGGDDAFWTLKVYGVPVASIVDVRAESEAAVRAALAAARASEPAASAGGFDIYADGSALTYIKENCVEDDTRGLFGLAVFPVDQSDLLQSARDGGREYRSLNFEFPSRGAALDGKCVAVRDLPEFPISHVETGQYIPGESRLWNVLIPLDGYHERYRRALASLSDKQPAIRSDFDVYLKDGALTYVKESCAQGDTRGRFFLSVFPADPDDLPQTARDAGLGHEPLNFDFERGAIFDGKCAIIRDLPDYPISRIETGQFIPGEGELWSARVSVGDGR